MPIGFPWPPAYKGRVGPQHRKDRGERISRGNRFRLDREKNGMSAPNHLFELQQALYESRNPTRRRLHRARHHWVSEAIAGHAAQAPLPAAIEYGPGSGIYLPILARHFKEVLAADVEPAYLAGIRPLLERIPRLGLATDDITRSRLPEGSFGLALCSEVLEHVDSPERALANLHRILHPGGIAIVTTPQRFSVMELCCKVAFLPGVIQAVRRIYGEPVLETGHVSLRTSRAFRTALGHAGFRVLRQARFGLYLPLVAEFGGEAGGRAIAALEERLLDTRLDWMLWTQAYVLQKTPG